LTTDVTQVSDPITNSSGAIANNQNGSLDIRIKYIYALFTAPDLAFLTKPNAEAGIVHLPFIDWEEHVNYYRLQDTMFLERNGITSSADYGVTLATLLGGCVDENYQKNVNPAYPGRYGSIQMGIYNGGGYTTTETNHNKVLAGRVTIRPLPDIVPGLQLTYFGLTGNGNTSAEPNYSANVGFASFEHEYAVLTGQYYVGRGNQAGSTNGIADQSHKKGYSFFTELKPLKHFSLIGRFDHFDPDTKIKDNENNRYIGGIAWHIDRLHNNMVLLDYDDVEYKQPGKEHDQRLQLTLQVAF